MADHSHIRSTVNADGAVILNTRTGEVTTLNPGGVDVWQALQRGEDVETIVASLTSATGANQQIVREDIGELLESLRKHDLIPSAFSGKNP